VFRPDQESQRDAEDVSTIVVDANSRRVSIDGVPVHLTPIEYRLLERLVREAGHVVSRDELLSAARQREAEWHDRALDVHVSHLRAKLNGHGQAIRTVRGEGYVFWMEAGN
jgi:two-component system, OmpR family, response regulator